MYQRMTICCLVSCQLLKAEWHCSLSLGLQVPTDAGTTWHQKK